MGVLAVCIARELSYEGMGGAASPAHRSPAARRALERRFSLLERRFSLLERRFSLLKSLLEQRFSLLERRFSLLEQRFSLLERRFSLLKGSDEQRFSRDGPAARRALAMV